MLLRFKPSNARPARSSPIFTPHSQPKPSKTASRDAQAVCANASHRKLCYVGEDARRPQPKSWRWRVRRKRLPFLGLIRPLMAPARVNRVVEGRTASGISARWMLIRSGLWTTWPFVPACSPRLPGVCWLGRFEFDIVSFLSWRDSVEGCRC